MAIPDKEKLFEKLENEGEKTVRENLAQGLYAGRNRVGLISEWLRQKEDARNEAKKTESNFLQRKSVRLSGLAILVTILGVVISKWF